MKELTLTINPITTQIGEWTAFAIQPDMQSYSGIYMTLGKGAIYSKSYKQKLNIKCSTEADLVVIDDAMCQILWSR